MIEQNHVRFLNLFHLKVSFVFSSLSEKQRPTFSYNRSYEQNQE